jgi:hypothetical protein
MVEEAEGTAASFFFLVVVDGEPEPTGVEVFLLG